MSDDNSLLEGNMGNNQQQNEIIHHSSSHSAPRGQQQSEGRAHSYNQSASELPQIGKQHLNKQKSPSQMDERDGKYQLHINSRTFDANARSMSVVPINGAGRMPARQAIREGIDMLEAKYMQKDNQVKAQKLESRIKRLVFEENRAKKLTEIANEKAEKLLRARDRHQKSLEEKLERERVKMEKIEFVKEQNRLQKQAHQERIQHNKFQIQQRTMGMKRVMVNQEKELFERRIRDEEIDYWRKRKQRDEIDQSKRQFIHMKIESQKIIEQQQRQNYQLLQEERHQKISSISNQINQLEDVERLLVDKLGMTQMNQHQALANLHKVVQICNSGINLHDQRPNQQNMMVTSERQIVKRKFHTIQDDTPMGPLKINQDSATYLQNSQDEHPQDDGGGMMITGVDADQSYQQKVQAGGE